MPRDEFAHLVDRVNAVEVALALRRAPRKQAVTTEKDAVNLGHYLSALAPMAVVPVRMELVDAGNVVDTMLGKVRERRLGA